MGPIFDAAVRAFEPPTAPVQPPPPRPQTPREVDQVLVRQLLEARTQAATWTQRAETAEFAVMRFRAGAFYGGFLIPVPQDPGQP